ncbi:hypothetical protein [Vibrio owensii]|uniref:hypothetical protein n=1 Tax=Vibrio owensii TaxID=696485 RepID=UPI00221F3BA9|nr:hypothetical protein [Vibrio owensii]
MKVSTYILFVVVLLFTLSFLDIDIFKERMTPALFEVQMENNTDNEDFSYNILLFSQMNGADCKTENFNTVEHITKQGVVVNCNTQPSQVVLYSEKDHWVADIIRQSNLSLKVSCAEGWHENSNYCVHDKYDKLKVKAVISSPDMTDKGITLVSNAPSETIQLDSVIGYKDVGNSKHQLKHKKSSSYNDGGYYFSNIDLDVKLYWLTNNEVTDQSLENILSEYKNYNYVGYPFQIIIENRLTNEHFKDIKRWQKEYFLLANFPSHIKSCETSLSDDNLDLGGFNADKSKKSEFELYIDCIDSIQQPKAKVMSRKKIRQNGYSLIGNRLKGEVAKSDTYLKLYLSELNKYEDFYNYDTFFHPTYHHSQSVLKFRSKFVSFGNSDYLTNSNQYFISDVIFEVNYM